MIPAGELAQIRAEAASWLPDTCAVVRPGVPYSDGAGGWVPASPTTVATVACAVAPVGVGTEGEIGGTIAEQADWVVTVPALTDVLVTDQITTGGRTFEILGVNAPRSLEVTRRLYCRVARS